MDKELGLVRSDVIRDIMAEKLELKSCSNIGYNFVSLKLMIIASFISFDLAAKNRDITVNFPHKDGYGKIM
jgi:hypothetical protein